MSGIPWSPDDVRHLKNISADSDTLSDTVRRFNAIASVKRSRHAIKNYVCVNEIYVKGGGYPKSNWSQEEFAVLKSLFHPDISAKNLWLDYNVEAQKRCWEQRKRKSVNHQRRKLIENPSRHRKWSEQEIDSLCSLVYDAESMDHLVVLFSEVCEENGWEYASKASVKSMYRKRDPNFKISHYRWSETEIEILRELLNKYPISVAVNKYCYAATKRGFIKRTTVAINSKICRAGLTRNIFRLDNFTTTEISDILDISFDRVSRWCKVFGLSFHTLKTKKKTRYISLSSFQSFARANPEQVSDVDPDNLAWLMDSEEFVDNVAYLVRKSQCVRVYKIDVFGKVTKIYPSIRAAAKAEYIGVTTMMSYISGKQELSGHLFQREDERIRKGLDLFDNEDLFQIA
jgi:hypothetical protein